MFSRSRGVEITTYVWIAALGAGLGVLAMLQYRWIGQVAEAERDRLRQDLSVLSMRVIEDFRRELASLFRMAAPVNRSGEVDLQAYYQGLSADSQMQDPRLVRRLFHVALDGDHPPQLEAFDPETGRLTTVDWPGELQSVRRRIERRGLGDGSPLPSAGFATDEPEPTDPILLIPVRQQPFEPRPPQRFTIIELSGEYLAGTFLPEMVARHFPADGAYRAAIVHKSTTLFETAAGEGAELARSPDIQRSVFRAEEFPSPFQALTNGGRRGPRPGMFRRPGPPIPGGEPGAGPDGARGRRGESGPGPFLRPERRPGFAATPVLAPDWQLVVKHSAGSVDQAVSSLKYRNLAISFAILMVLAAAIVVTTISNHRAKNLSHLRMDFVARVSHELKTPVTVIRSAAFNLVKGIIHTPEDVSRYGRMIDEEGRRLGEMVDQIMLFSRMESGAANYNLQAVDVRDLVTKTVAALSSAMEKQGCVVETDFPSDLPAASADPTALSHCVQNLVTNAAKYGQTAKSCEIRVAALFDPASQEVRISVSDGGKGIDPSDLPLIFEPFYRGQSVSAETPGNGLGLSLVRRTMEGLGGRVSVESTPGRGSRFTLHVPVCKASRTT